MDNIIFTLGTPEMIAALEANMEEEMMYFGRTLTGGEIYNDGEVEGFFTGRKSLNGILRTHLHSVEKEPIEAKIKAVLHYFQEKQVSKIGWSVGQDTQPAQMDVYLESCGFTKIPDENLGMALDVEMVHSEEKQLEGLEIHEIEDLASLEILKRMEIEGFGSSEEMAQNYYDMYASAGFGPGTVWRHWAGWWHGEAVAATSLLFHAGVAGIYGVTTLPAARRQGIAQALVLHAIKEAKRSGYRIVVLSPTEMSEGIYHRLGFRTYTRIRHFSYTMPSPWSKA
jgi:GNAT superfamily N-acetyltransferase